MAIINCKECGGTVPTKTNICLRCGVVQQTVVRGKHTETVSRLQGEVEDLKPRLERAERKGKDEERRRLASHRHKLHDDGLERNRPSRSEMFPERFEQNIATRKASSSKNLSTKRIVGAVKTNKDSHCKKKRRHLVEMSRLI